MFPWLQLDYLVRSLTKELKSPLLPCTLCARVPNTSCRNILFFSLSLFLFSSALFFVIVIFFLLFCNYYLLFPSSWGPRKRLVVRWMTERAREREKLFQEEYAGKKTTTTCILSEFKLQMIKTMATNNPECD